MKTKKKRADEKLSVPAMPRPLEATVGALGALSGAGMGALAAGPAGAVAGAIIGAAMGATTGWAADENTVETLEREKALDDEVGITSGPIGAPNLEHPPAKVGALSAEASGGNTARPGTRSDAEGPMEPPVG
jgi:hypothetical protein